MATQQEIEAMANEVCVATATMHTPGVDPAALNAANVRLVEVCQSPVAPLACECILVNCQQLMGQSVPDSAFIIAAGVVEVACRRGQVGGESVLRLMGSLPESLDGCVQKLASGAAFWCVEQGLEERALLESSLTLNRTVYLSTALGDELSDRWAPHELASRPSCAGAMRLSLEHLCGTASTATARCVSSWAGCGATLHSCPPAVVSSLVATLDGVTRAHGSAGERDLAIEVATEGLLALRALAVSSSDSGEDARLAPLSEYAPLLRPLVAISSAMPHLHDHYGVGFANALGAYGATVCELLAARLCAHADPQGPQTVERDLAFGALTFLSGNVGHVLPNVAEAATDAVVKVFEAVPEVRPPWRRQLGTHVARAVAARESDAFYASGVSREDHDDTEFNRRYCAGPALYKLVFAMEETEISEEELLHLAPWLEAAMEAIFADQEEDEESDEE